MLFYPSDISHFHFFCCHLGPQLGSLQRKCDPDRCDQNSHRSCLCFFTQQTFSIFKSLAVAWGPNLGPCCKSVILTVAIKNHIKIVYVFYPADISIFVPLTFTWCPNLDPCGKGVILTGAIKIRIKIGYVFYPADIFHFHPFGCHLGSQLGSLRQKCDPDSCGQNLHKSRL